MSTFYLFLIHSGLIFYFLILKQKQQKHKKLFLLHWFHITYSNKHDNKFKYSEGYKTTGRE